jgi:hypothetical protein
MRSTPPAPTPSATPNSPKQSGKPQQVRHKDRQLSRPSCFCASRDRLIGLLIELLVLPVLILLNLLLYLVILPPAMQAIIG